MLMNLRVHKTMKSFFDRRVEGRITQEMFCAHFQPKTGTLSQTSCVKNGDEEIQALITCKQRRAITEVERKAIRDYYFNYKDGKLAQKVVCARFLQEF